MRHLKRLGTVAIAIVAGLAMTGVPAEAAAPDTVGQEGAVPGGFASWADLLRMQENMNAAAYRVIAAARADAGSGYAGVIADPVNRELRVYWKGSPPANLASVARAAVPMRVLPAAHTEREMKAGTARLAARPGIGLTQVGPSPDGSGLVVGTAGTALPAKGRAAFAAIAGVPVSRHLTVAPVAATRANDASPWSGGSRWINVTRNTGCSTGFGIVFPSGARRVLTAGHCGNAGDVARDPTAEFIGLVSILDVEEHDVLVLNANGQGRVFNNSVNAAGGVVQEFTNRVVGIRTSVPGNIVCSSGANSGTRCQLRVALTGQCIQPTGLVQICDEVAADRIDGTNAAGQGDSGGPIEIVNAADTTTVFATGTFTAFTNQVPCTGYVPTGRLCGSRIFYQDISAGLAAVGATGVVLG